MEKRENKKVSHKNTIICASSSVDKDSNMLSIFNIIEEVNVNIQSIDSKSVDLTQKKPVQFPFEIVSIWERVGEPKDVSAEIKLALYDPDNNLMQEMPYNLEIKSIHQRMRIRIKVNGLNVTKQGNYYFSVLFKNKESFEEVGRVPLTIKITASADLNLLKK